MTTQLPNENVEETEVPQPTEPQEEAPQEPVTEEESDTGEDFDPKERVEISDPKVLKKFNHIYKQMKMSDARNQMLLDMNQKALDKIAEFEKRFSQTDSAEAERVLLSRIKEARENGDESRADQIMLELVDLRAENKVKQAVPKVEKLKPVEYTPEAIRVAELATETDAQGNVLRPWIAQDHPQHEKAMNFLAATAIKVQSELGFVDIDTVTREVDKLMNTKNAPPKNVNTRAPEPMRGGLTNTQPRGKLKLSPQEAEIASKLGVKPEEYLKWKR